MFFTTGGFPFGDGDAFHRPRREVDNSKYYDLLGVPKDASVSDIKKAYRKLAIKHHPDKGGDQELFKEVSRAYEVLSDPDKRRVYDEHGEEGLDGQSAADPTDIFDLFFGGGKPRAPSGKRRGEDIESPIKVTLEQIYTGATRKMAISKDTICDICDGHGGPKELLETCSLCNGTGVRVQIRRFGPMTQQTQSACVSCRQGKVMPDGKQCQKCSGIGTCKEKKVLEVYIDKGVPNGHKITFSGEADHRPNTIPGDVRFIVDEQPHAMFRRREHNLFMSHEISLYEALTGFKFLVRHLDGRKLLISSTANEIIQHNATKIVRYEGMPIYRNPMERGHLFVEFHIVMPTPQTLGMKGPQLNEALKKILPVPQKPKVNESDPDIEQCELTDPSSDDMHGKSQHRSDGYDEEGEEDGGPRVQCRQQ